METYLTSIPSPALAWAYVEAASVSERDTLDGFERQRAVRALATWPLQALLKNSAEQRGLLETAV